MRKGGGLRTQMTTGSRLPNPYRNISTTLTHSPRFLNNNTNTTYQPHYALLPTEIQTKGSPAPPTLGGSPIHALRLHKSMHTPCRCATPLTVTLPPPYSQNIVPESESPQRILSLCAKLNCITTIIQEMRRKGDARHINPNTSTISNTMPAASAHNRKHLPLPNKSQANNPQEITPRNCKTPHHRLKYREQRTATLKTPTRRPLTLNHNNTKPGTENGRYTRRSNKAW